MKSNVDLKPLIATAPEGPIRRRYIKFVWSGEPDVETRYREMMFVGDFGTGKSRALLDSLLISALKYPGAQLALLRDTKKNIDISVVPMLKKVWAPAFEMKYLTPHWSDGLIEVHNGSQIWLFGLDHPKSEDKLKSTEFLRIFVEQAELIPEEMWNLAMVRTRQRGVYHEDLGVEGTRFIKGVANWGEGENWIKVRFRDQATQLEHRIYETPVKDRKTGRVAYRLLVEGTAEENHSLADDYFDAILLAGESTKDKYFSGDWGTKKGLVAPQFRHTDHTVARIELSGHYPLVVGIDHGVRHPTVAIFSFVDDFGNISVYDEYIRTDLSASDNAYNIARILMRAYEQGHKEVTLVLDRSTKRRERDLGSVWDDFFNTFREYLPKEMRWYMVEGSADVEYRASKLNQLLKQRRIAFSTVEAPQTVRMLSSTTWEDVQKDVVPWTDIFDALGYLVTATVVKSVTNRFQKEELKRRISRRRVSLV